MRTKKNNQQQQRLNNLATKPKSKHNPASKFHNHSKVKCESNNSNMDDAFLDVRFIHFLTEWNVNGKMQNGNCCLKCRKGHTTCCRTQTYNAQNIYMLVSEDQHSFIHSHFFLCGWWVVLPYGCWNTTLCVAFVLAKCEWVLVCPVYLSVHHTFNSENRFWSYICEY